MTSNDQEQNRAKGRRSSRSEEQDAALFGPPGRGEYQRGETLQFRDPQSGEVFTARVIYVRAPAPAIKGGKVHPTVYMVYVQGEHLPRALYLSHVIEKAEPHRNTGS